jgi:CheY-like chemotaxis protein
MRTVLPSLPADVTDQLQLVLIEDNEIDCMVIERYLNILGITPKIFNDFASAAAYLQNNPPDIIFSDYRMPGYFDFPLFGFLQEDERLKNIPVFIVSAETGADFQRKMLRNGAKGFIEKPARADKIAAAIASVVSETAG